MIKPIFIALEQLFQIQKRSNNVQCSLKIATRFITGNHLTKGVYKNNLQAILYRHCYVTPLQIEIDLHHWTARHCFLLDFLLIIVF